MARKTSSVTVVTAPFVLSYPKLLKPEPYMEDGKPVGDPVYSFEGISEIDSLSDWREVNREADTFDPISIEARLVALAKEQWGDDFSVKDAVKHETLTWPFKSGDKKADKKGEKGEHYRGKKFWRAKALAEIKGNPNEPNLYLRTKEGLEQLHRGTATGVQMISQKFYGGAICTAELTAVASEAGGKKYVTFYVNAVVFQEDGDRLGGGSAVEKMYGVKGGSSNYDPTEGMDSDLDDEIPY